MPLDHDEQIHLTAAQGFVELQMFLDADAELDGIDPFCRQLPEVLAVRLDVYLGLGKWELVETVAARLAEFDPDNSRWVITQAWATRKNQSLAAGLAVLENSCDRYASDARFAFTLACFLCRLGEVTDAKAHLLFAFQLDPGLRLEGLENSDLKPIWNDIADLPASDQN